MICISKTVVYASFQKLHQRNLVPEVRGRTQLTQTVTCSKPVSVFLVGRAMPELKTLGNDSPLPCEPQNLSFFSVSI